MNREFDEKDIAKMNAYLNENMFGFFTDKIEFYATEEELAETPATAFIYEDTRNNNEKGVFLGTPTQNKYQMDVIFCLLSEIHTITAEIEVGIDGKKIIVSENHHFGLNKGGITFENEKKYDEIVADLVAGIPYDGKIPVKIIDAKDAELAAKGDTDAINKILKAAAEIA